mmetsp:Transcript_1437/g.935  ORF Transcript_1437/g.935 Transcript_1437/m.935 type:complete len:353 (-) Transcript_1437:826-1884(-)|eukprot:CAMPEP_0202978088 /NCGR_PEP_ID=MMETSP1396-20130829/84636_1 /ASSEMBLY_ACC=CAM_ASM_000872 /TAXON_ID= /ORGANISM="Pseudokeronopsis sp., Strain Brazil" /LENGTH=352 /DNA_ID=CAMNT_0049716957 /DNA_START=826 /DNA_END=1884 /DNA_ORIENTATION=-
MEIVCDGPNDQLYSFQGSIFIPHLGRKVGLSNEQVLLRGSTLRNTEFVYGIALYTGHETKIMKNSVKSKAKLSKLEKATNMYIILMVILQIAICLVAAAFSAIITVNAQDSSKYSYLEFSEDDSFAYLFFVAFGTWFLAFMNLVPISLMVTLEVVKFIQAYFMQWDALIYDLEKDQAAKVQSSNLNEELGMIHFVFSDKTGTLTQNVMEFKKFTAGNQSYGLSKVDPANQKFMVPGLTNVCFDDPVFYEHYANRDHENYNAIKKFVELLGLCHTVIEEYSENETLRYNASSPDELALVNAARYFGYEFRGRDVDNNILVNDRGTEKTFRLLNVIEFTSLRKRMTTVLYDNSL